MYTSVYAKIYELRGYTRSLPCILTCKLGSWPVILDCRIEISEQKLLSQGGGHLVFQSCATCGTCAVNLKIHLILLAPSNLSLFYDRLTQLVMWLTKECLSVLQVIREHFPCQDVTSISVNSTDILAFTTKYSIQLRKYMLCLLYVLNEIHHKLPEWWISRFERKPEVAFWLHFLSCVESSTSALTKQKLCGLRGDKLLNLAAYWFILSISCCSNI